MPDSACFPSPFGQPGIQTGFGQAVQIWKAEFDKLFALEFPYIKKIADSHRLPLGDLMNIFPDAPTPQGLLGLTGQSIQAPPVDPAVDATPETSRPAP